METLINILTFKELAGLAVVGVFLLAGLVLCISWGVASIKEKIRRNKEREANEEED